MVKAASVWLYKALALCFRREQRLLKTDDFSSVFHLRTMRSNPFFQVYARPNGLEVARLGLVVGKKVAKQAVRRNFIKRSVRETFRLNHDRFIGFDFVVRSRVAFNRQQSHEARRALIALFAKLASCRASSSR